VAAVALPLQTNFEHLNMNPLLLALVVAAAADLREGRETRAGVWVGLATALKLFPGLLLAYLAFRRRWRGVAVGGAVAAVATAAALLPYGVGGGLDVLGDWLHIVRQGGWAVAPGNQSIAALVTRLGGGREVTLAVDLLVLAAAALALQRTTAERDTVGEVGLVALLAVLVSPIAWWHYYVLLFPVWLTALTRYPPMDRRIWSGALVVAGILTSGVLTFGRYAWRRSLLETSIYAWGALLLLMLVLLECHRRRAAHRQVHSPHSAPELL
jgi:alpha-1,2-mannosyltransferase